MQKNIEVEVARLDGYLSGVSSLSGCIGRYSAFAYLVNRGNENRQIENLLKDFYSPQAAFVFDSVEDLGGGLGDLEREIRPYLVSNVLGVSEDVFKDGAVIERRKYISFVIMDIIDLVIDSRGAPVKVIRLKGRCKEAETRCVFFCVLANEFFLVLQFNGDE